MLFFIAWLFATIMLISMMASAVTAKTWHILADGSGDAPTIQGGIDSAIAGDTVLVGPGTYLENLVILTKDLVLRAEFEPEITILDGSGHAGSVIYLSAQTREMVVEGFTITGGTGHPRSGVADGGGIHLANRASPIIRHNRILGNGAQGVTFFGGGISQYTEFSSPLIEGNLFEQNTARLGGAISLASGGSEVRNNVFRSNIAATDGGAMYVDFLSGIIDIENNQFWNNHAGDHGGGIHVAGKPEILVHVEWNLLVQNRADGSARDYASGGAVFIGEAGGTVLNNTIVDNIGPTWTNCGGGGLSLQSTPQNLEIFGNLLALNTSCALTCEYGNLNTLGPNLFWMNETADIGSGLGACPSQWSNNQIFADPLFCSPETGNYSVSIDSPALAGPVIMGVWTSPGCGPGVAIRTTTWGRIKAIFR